VSILPFLYTNSLKIKTTQCSFDACPDPTFHFDADPDPDPTLGSPLLENQEFIFIFIYSSANLNCFIFLASVIGIIISNIMESKLKFSGKNSRSASPFVAIDTDPDPPKGCQSDKSD
jgi:hypothetical protein